MIFSLIQRDGDANFALHKAVPARFGQARIDVLHHRTDGLRVAAGFSVGVQPAAVAPTR